MEKRSSPVRRKSHTSTADLLTWSETPPPHFVNPSATRSHQPSDAIGKMIFGGQVTDEEAHSLSLTKPCSGYKLKEMTGSGIFAAADDEGGDGTSETDAVNSGNKTRSRMYQQTMTGISQISFGSDEKISPRKPASLPEFAKQRELSGTLLNESEAKTQKLISDAKSKELSGHDIFGPPPETVPRSLAATRSHESKGKHDMGEPAPRTIRTSVKVSNPAGGQSNILFSEEPVIESSKKIHDNKFAELTGSNIFKGDAPAGSAEKPLSNAKLREMTGNDIFADVKAESRDYFGGVRKPPGGASSIALI